MSCIWNSLKLIYDDQVELFALLSDRLSFSGDSELIESKLHAIAHGLHQPLIQ